MLLQLSFLAFSFIFTSKLFSHISVATVAALARAVKSPDLLADGNIVSSSRLKSEKKSKNTI